MKAIRSETGLRVGMVLGGLVVTSLLCGCGATLQARKATPSGFLGDYSQLKQGGDDQALLLYVNPKADFRTYDKVLLDPVRVYAGKESKIAKIPREDLQTLVNYFDVTVREHLKADYTFVNAPGPGVMRLQIAITDAKASGRLMDTVSSVTPPGIVLSGLKQMATGTPAATGTVGAECQALDSESNVRLFAAVDARAGQKYTGKFDKFNKWRTAQGAFDYWAEHLQMRLREQLGTAAR